jgi:hypothetical protein
MEDNIEEVGWEGVMKSYWQDELSQESKKKKSSNLSQKEVAEDP